jgi:hypothetical protein
MSCRGPDRSLRMDSRVGAVAEAQAGSVSRRDLLLLADKEPMRTASTKAFSTLQCASEITRLPPFKYRNASNTKRLRTLKSSGSRRPGRPVQTMSGQLPSFPLSWSHYSGCTLCRARLPAASTRRNLCAPDGPFAVAIYSARRVTSHLREDRKTAQRQEPLRWAGGVVGRFKRRRRLRPIIKGL